MLMLSVQHSTLPSPVERVKSPLHNVDDIIIRGSSGLATTVKLVSNTQFHPCGVVFDFSLTCLLFLLSIVTSTIIVRDTFHFLKWVVYWLSKKTTV